MSGRRRAGGREQPNHLVIKVDRARQRIGDRLSLDDQNAQSCVSDEVGGDGTDRPSTDDRDVERRATSLATTSRAGPIEPIASFKVSPKRSVGDQAIPTPQHEFRILVFGPVIGIDYAYPIGR